MGLNRQQTVIYWTFTEENCWETMRISDKTARWQSVNGDISGDCSHDLSHDLTQDQWKMELLFWNVQK